MKKKMKLIEIVDEEITYCITGNFHEFKKYFQDKMDMVPEEFRDSASISLETDCDYHECCNLDLRVSYLREETEEEHRKRFRKDKVRRDYIEEQELCKLEQLKKKYNC